MDATVFVEYSTKKNIYYIFSCAETPITVTVSIKDPIIVSDATKLQENVVKGLQMFCKTELMPIEAYLENTGRK